MSSPPAAGPRCTSERFNAPNADVIIRSSDGVQFSLHRTHLAINTGAFPPLEIETSGEIVDLSEDADTLELLFQFIYRQRHPNLIDTPYKVVAPLAEAAEKYEVFAAMNICEMKMMNFLPMHAEGIMAYAAKHGYHDIADKAAPLLIALPFEDVIKILPQHLVVPWVRYRQQWSDILLAAITSKPTGCAPCPSCGSYMSCRSNTRSTLTLDLNLSSITSLASMVQALGIQSSLRPQIDSWCQNIQMRLGSIMKFSTFI